MKTLLMKAVRLSLTNEFKKKLKEVESNVLKSTGEIDGIRRMYSERTGVLRNGVTEGEATGWAEKVYSAKQFDIPHHLHLFWWCPRQ